MHNNYCSNAETIFNKFCWIICNKLEIISIMLSLVSSVTRLGEFRPSKNCLGVFWGYLLHHLVTLFVCKIFVMLKIAKLGPHVVWLRFGEMSPCGQNFKNHWAYFEGTNMIWQYIEPTFANNFCNWANIHVYNLPNCCTNNLVICPHCPLTTSMIL